MRKYLLLLFICFGLSMSAQEVQISWNKDITISKALAKSENKPILMFFTKNDCESCMQFYTNFFKSETLKNQIDNFVFLMVDGSNNDTNTNDLSVIKNRRLVNLYNNSQTFPSVVILDSDGRTMGEPLLSTDASAIDTFINFLDRLK